MDDRDQEEERLGTAKRRVRRSFVASNCICSPRIVVRVQMQYRCIREYPERRSNVQLTTQDDQLG